MCLHEQVVGALSSSFMKTLGASLQADRSIGVILMPPYTLYRQLVKQRRSTDFIAEVDEFTRCLSDAIQYYQSAPLIESSEDDTLVWQEPTVHSVRLHLQ
jgi:hypothetical protein